MLTTAQHECSQGKMRSLRVLEIQQTLEQCSTNIIPQNYCSQSILGYQSVGNQIVTRVNKVRRVSILTPMEYCLAHVNICTDG